MKRWLIVVSVEKAQGIQTYEVAAASAEEARRLWESGDVGECVHEEIEATDLGEPEITEIKVEQGR